MLRKSGKILARDRKSSDLVYFSLECLNVSSSTILNENLLCWQSIRERGNDFSGQKVENQSKSNGEGQRGQCFSEDGQKHEGQAQPDQNGDEAGQGRVPVAVRAGFTHQNRVENEVAKAEFDAPIFLFFYLWLRMLLLRMMWLLRLLYLSPLLA